MNEKNWTKTNSIGKHTIVLWKMEQKLRENLIFILEPYKKNKSLLRKIWISKNSLKIFGVTEIFFIIEIEIDFFGIRTFDGMIKQFV